MEFGFVSRKKYEIARHNYKLCNDRRLELSEKNIELQKRNKELETLVKLYRGEQKEAKKCKNCGNYFIPKSLKQKNCEKCIKVLKHKEEEN